jgi:DNA-binding transcriptional LysR family regulator
MVTLRQLEIFLAVARRQHVGAGAVECHLSQSAVSAALRALEDGLGGALFERDGRRIRLTDRGRRLAEEAESLVQRAKDLVQHFVGDEGVAGRLRIGASSTIGNYLLPQRVGAFVAAHDGVSVDLQVGNSAEMEARLAAHELDVAYVEGPPHHPSLEAVAWREDRLVVFVAASHPFAGRRRMRPSTLRELRFVMRESGSGTRDVFESALRARGVQVEPYLTFGNSEAVKQAVRGGLGAGCLSIWSVEREIAAGDFVVLKVDGLDLRRTLWRLLRRGAYCSRLLGACLTALDADAAR